MNRRKFLALLGLAPALPLLAKLPVSMDAPTTGIISYNGFIIAARQVISYEFDAAGTPSRMVEGEITTHPKDQTMPNLGTFVPDVPPGWRRDWQRITVSIDGHEYGYKIIDRPIA